MLKGPPLGAAHCFYQTRERASGGEIVGVARLDPEGGVPGVDVAGGAHHAERRRRRAGRRPSAACRAVGARLVLPRLGEGQEQALVAGQPVDHRRRLAAQRGVVGVERHLQPAQVGDVLAHGQLAVDLAARQRLVGRRTACPARRPGRRTRLASSAVHQSRSLPVGVDLAALVVEAVADLVADHRADRRRSSPPDRRCGSKNGGLQDAGREDDLVLQPAVVGVHRLRGHAPLAVVDRLAQVAQRVGPLEAPAGR